MKFTKMQGCGNDYVYINCFEEEIKEPEKLAVVISNRNFGVGSDGLILILPSEKADCRMRMFNWDGSEAEMCGNGVRCVGKYVHDRGIAKKDRITVDTLAGIKTLDISTDEQGNAALITVDMGEPILKPDDIPVEAADEPVKGLALTAADKTFDFTCVSMGNPHAVTFIERAADFDVDKYGSILEVDAHFPRRANIEFIEVIGENKLKMRVWERGAGETLACGTGACAAAVAAVLNGKCGREKIELQLLGGSLYITWDEATNHVFMTGPAEFSFDGVWLK